MNKILTLLIISIALIGISTVSASSDADNFNLDLPIVAGPFNAQLNVPFDVGADVDGPFSLPIIGAADSNGPFNLPVNIPVVGSSFNLLRANDIFNLPVVSAANVNNPLDMESKDISDFSINIPIADGPFSLPISISSIDVPFGLSIMD